MSACAMPAARATQAAPARAGAVEVASTNGTTRKINCKCARPSQCLVPTQRSRGVAYLLVRVLLALRPSVCNETAAFDTLSRQRVQRTEHRRPRQIRTRTSTHAVAPTDVRRYTPPSATPGVGPRREAARLLLQPATPRTRTPQLSTTASTAFELDHLLPSFTAAHRCPQCCLGPPSTTDAQRFEGGPHPHPSASHRMCMCMCMCMCMRMCMCMCMYYE